MGGKDLKTEPVSKVWEQFTENEPAKHVKCKLCELYTWTYRLKCFALFSNFAVIPYQIKDANLRNTTDKHELYFFNAGI